MRPGIGGLMRPTMKGRNGLTKNTSIEGLPTSPKQARKNSKTPSCSSLIPSRWILPFRKRLPCPRPCPSEPVTIFHQRFGTTSATRRAIKYWSIRRNCDFASFLGSFFCYFAYSFTSPLHLLLLGSLCLVSLARSLHVSRRALCREI